MKGKFTLNKILHNNKLMMGFSLVAAITIWAVVVYVIGFEETRSIIVDVPLDLGTSYAGMDGMQIYEPVTQQVTITVKGSRAVIYSLSENDFSAKGDYSGILKAGTFDVNLNVTQNGGSSQYDWYPKKMTIMCDYEQSADIEVKADTSNVSVEDISELLKGTPVIDLTDTKVHVEGPKSEVSQIASLVATVDTPAVITEATAFSTRIRAYDQNGAEVNIEHCNIYNTTVIVTVPVVVNRTVNFTYTMANLPESYINSSTFCTISPTSINLVGSPGSVDSLITSLENLGIFNFNHISLNDGQKTIALSIPKGVSVLDNTSQVTVSFDMTGLTSKTVNLALTSAGDNLSVVNPPSNHPFKSAPEQVISNLTLIGSSESIDQIQESDLTAVVDLSDYTGNGGAVQHDVSIKVNGYKDVWVYYGSTDPKIWLNLQ